MKKGSAVTRHTRRHDGATERNAYTYSRNATAVRHDLGVYSASAAVSATFIVTLNPTSKSSVAKRRETSSRTRRSENVDEVRAQSKPYARVIDERTSRFEGMRGGVRGRGEDVYQRVQTPCRSRARRSRARSRMRPCACIIRRAEKTLSKNHCRTAAIAPPTISRRRHYITGAPPGRVATATDDIQRTISQLSTVTRARLHFCGNNRGKKTAIDTPVTAATC